LIRALIDAGGVTTIRQLAQVFLLQDESQLQYYEDRIRKMPVKVLKSHDVIAVDGDLVRLRTAGLTLEQKSHIRMLCEMKLQQFIQKKGLGIWDYRMLEMEPVDDVTRLTLLARAKGRCEACGATKDDRPLHIDHIKPRSKGGTNAIENLQVLCDKCNLAKSNKVEIDFRKIVPDDSLAGCPFCASDFQTKAIEELDTVFAVHDQYPVTPGHTLIVSKRHVSDFFDITDKERSDTNGLLRIIKIRLLGTDASIRGFNIGCNAGKSAGQTVMHYHMHLIPRRDGDVDNPMGGVRGVIPSRMRY
jgi:diadenosine tetraphosphate (Ap4A) HIT family hydrolase